MSRTPLNKDKTFKWLSAPILCPDEKLLKHNYTFYTKLGIDNIEFEIGSGVLVNVNDVKYFGCIHYFYENNRNKLMVAVEIFYRAKEIAHKLDKDINLNRDIEVIKKDNLVLAHLSVTSLTTKCILVYGLEDENPEELLEEFVETTTDPIYICRFIASFSKGKYKLRGAVENEINISDSESESNNSIEIINETTPISNQKFIVSHLETDDNKILMKIKRNLNKSFENSPKDKIDLKSPSTLMQNLSISNNMTSPRQELTNNFDKININSPGSDKKLYVLLDRNDIDKSPVKINNESRKSSRISTRRSSKLQENQTPTRVSKRQGTRKSYVDYYVSPEAKILWRSPRRRATQTDDKIAVTPSQRIETIDEGIIKTNRQLRNVSTPKTIDEVVKSTPKSVRTRNAKVEFKTEPIEETPSRKKRASIAQLEVTPKKQSKILNTPKSGRINVKNMTPLVQERVEPIVFCNTPMSRARLGLSAHNLPSQMPCREHEYISVFNFISTRIKDQTSGCMYISGVPGTGKTMTVFKVMSDLSEEKDEYGDFVFLKLNALALTEPRQIYVEIIKKLLNKKVHWEEALKEINKFFKSKKKKITHIILIDELDKLCNRKQDVVYNLLDLPFNSVTPLVLITIANTMDLPERILSNKVNSRLGLVRQTFKPYQYKDLVKIVTARLATDAVFKNEALELVARKVAAVSGDARRALTMCSRATEIAEEENKELITMEIVDRVLREMSSSSKVQAIQSCSKLEKNILYSISNEVSRTGNEEVPFLNMFYNLEKLSALENFKLPSIEVCLKACHNLGSFRLLITQHGRTDIHMTLMLNISIDDIHYALQNN